jgi:hypothetical protein
MDSWTLQQLDMPHSLDAGGVDGALRSKALEVLWQLLVPEYGQVGLRSRA